MVVQEKLSRYVSEFDRDRIWTDTATTQAFDPLIQAYDSQSRHLVVKT